jgi:hypothetical protein
LCAWRAWLLVRWCSCTLSQIESETGGLRAANGSKLATMQLSTLASRCTVNPQTGSNRC